MNGWIKLGCGFLLVLFVIRIYSDVNPEKNDGESNGYSLLWEGRLAVGLFLGMMAIMLGNCIYALINGISSWPIFGFAFLGQAWIIYNAATRP
jgi:hypothetical protein